MQSAEVMRRPSTRGVTLVEVLIVVAIIALVAGGVGVGVLRHWVGAQTRSAETNARTIRASVKAWWVDHAPGECPRVDELIAAGALDRDSPRQDPWGGAWRVHCSNDDVTVVSAGRDRTIGTKDDIRAPPTARDVAD